MSEFRRYGTAFGRQGQSLIVDTSTKKRLNLGSACTRLNEQDAEIERLKAENATILARIDTLMPIVEDAVARAIGEDDDDED